MIALALVLQKVEWGRERRMGYAPWSGAKLFAKSWDE
jgi:hypothetical protein